MYYRRLYLSFVVSLLLLSAFIFTGCNNNVSAQNNGTVVATEFFPIVGFPFASRKDDGSGEFETGSFTIDTFFLEDGDLLASGLLKGTSLNPSGVEIILPVEISTATCHVLEMDIGPPFGLLDPINVVSHATLLQDLTQQEHCQISQANASVDNVALVDLLNQEGNAAALGGCHWYTRWACSAAMGVCTAVQQGCNGDQFECPACKACLKAIGAGGCIVCVDVCQ